MDGTNAMSRKGCSGTRTYLNLNQSTLLKNSINEQRLVLRELLCTLHRVYAFPLMIRLHWDYINRSGGPPFCGNLKPDLSRRIRVACLFEANALDRHAGSPR